MRQWELFGITDSVPNWTPPPKPASGTTAGPVAEPAHAERRDEQPVVVDRFPSVLWTTDATLRFTSFPGLADLGISTAAIDVLDLFGLDGPGEDVVSAHVEALGGGAATFELSRAGRELHCWVSPVRGRDGQVCGTICVGIDLMAELHTARAEIA